MLVLGEALRRGRQRLQSGRTQVRPRARARLAERIVAAGFRQRAVGYGVDAAQAVLQQVLDTLPHKQARRMAACASPSRDLSRLLLKAF